MLFWQLGLTFFLEKKQESNYSLWVMKTDTIHKTKTFFLSILIFSMNSMSQKIKEFAPAGAELTYDGHDG